jgi:hypothetical protein
MRNIYGVNVITEDEHCALWGNPDFIKNAKYYPDRSKFVFGGERYKIVDHADLMPTIEDVLDG